MQPGHQVTLKPLTRRSRFIARKARVRLILDSLGDFFFTQGGLSHASMSSALSQPIVIYDELMSRFIVGDQDIDFTTHVSNFVIAVSKTSAPATLTATGFWNFYAISTSEMGYDADYPGNVGYNADAFVFTLNMFAVAAGSNHVLITTVNATDLANGVSQASLSTFHNDFSGFSLRPATMHGSNSGDPLWFVTEHGNNTSIDVVNRKMSCRIPRYFPPQVSLWPPIPLWFLRAIPTEQSSPIALTREF